MNRTSRRSVVGVVLAALAAAPVAAQPAEPEATQTEERTEKGPATPAGDAGDLRALEDALGMDLHTDRQQEGGYPSLGEDYYNKAITKEQLEERVASVQARRSARRKDHLEGLVGLWGAAVLAHPAARDELRLHARREARLTRAMFVAHTEAPPKLQEKLIPRIEKLIDVENDRYIAAMERLKSTPIPPTSASTPAAPAPAASAGSK